MAKRQRHTDALEFRFDGLEFGYEGIVKRTPWETMALVRSKDASDCIEVVAEMGKNQRTAAYRRWDRAKLFCPNDVLECFHGRKIRLTMKIQFDGQIPEIKTRSKCPYECVEVW